MRILIFIASTIMLFAASSVAANADLVELNKKRYEAGGKDNAVLLLHVNWGRQWKCAGLENAQLQALEFSPTSQNGGRSSEKSLLLEIPSKLFVKDTFVPLALLIEPGEYALSAFDVKVAHSSTKVGHLKAGESQLFKEGKPIGGTFSVQAGEIVYIGHFGLDCAKEPIPWRFYIEGKSEFEAYAKGFHDEFPFTKSVPVQFRLFSTTMFGQEYILQ